MRIGRLAVFGRELNKRQDAPLWHNTDTGLYTFSMEGVIVEESKNKEVGQVFFYTFVFACVSSCLLKLLKIYQQWFANFFPPFLPLTTVFSPSEGDNQQGIFGLPIRRRHVKCPPCQERIKATCWNAESHSAVASTRST